MPNDNQEIVDYLIQIEGELITAQDAVFRSDDNNFSTAWHFLNEAFHRVKLAADLISK